MPKRSEENKFALAMTVGTMISSQIVGGVLLGYLCDRWLGTSPWLSVIGLVLGTVSAFISLYRLMNKINDGDD